MAEDGELPIGHPVVAELRNPDGQVTRAEFIKMLDETFGLKTTVGVSYSDVKDTDWYAPYIGKAARKFKRAIAAATAQTVVDRSH